MVGENHQKPKKTQSKHKTKNQKTKTLKRLFGLASKHVFLVFILFFYIFLKVYGWRKSPKTQKTQSKHKTKNQKTKTLERLFGLASNNVFFDFHFVFSFGFEMQKQKKTLCFFVFLKVYGWRKSPKTKKHKANTKPKTKKPKL